MSTFVSRAPYTALFCTGFSLAESIAESTVTGFLVTVISPLAFCDMLDTNSSEVGAWDGTSVTGVCTVFSVAGSMPESTRLPLAFKPARWPSVAPETLSAFEPASEDTAFGVAAIVSLFESVALDSCTTPLPPVLASGTAHETGSPISPSAFWVNEVRNVSDCVVAVGAETVLGSCFALNSPCSPA